MSGLVPSDHVVATGFETREIYRSSKSLGYVSWVSFFPGTGGRWYVTCEEVSRPEKPLAKMSRDKWYFFGLPIGYDKSQYQMETVILESADGMKTWKVISRDPCHFHHSAGSFAQARTADGRFLRFVWACYSLEEGMRNGDIYSVSSDNGRTWTRQPEFHDSRFMSYPHRLRTLRDGTLVLALPLKPPPSDGGARPIIYARNLNIDTEDQMNLCFSHDQGRSWTAPVPIYGGSAVSETDFVELPSGDLLCINNSIFAHPGRQLVYRTAKGFVPGAFEKSTGSDFVPETVCLTEDGILVGCLRGPRYAWSDDLGATWHELAGIPDWIVHWKEAGLPACEVYQPWMHYLRNGRIACAGHLGFDEPIGNIEHTIMIHEFTLEVRRKTRKTRIDIVKDFDEQRNCWLNTYTLTLTSDGTPLADKVLEVWYSERGKPEYDYYDQHTLEQRMKMGGETVRVKTDKNGKARVTLSRFDDPRTAEEWTREQRIEWRHHCIKMVALFNRDRRDPDCVPAQSLQYTFYSIWHQDPPLEERG